MAEPLMIFPFGGNGKEALMCVQAINRVAPVWDVVGFIDDDPLTHGRLFLDVPVLGGKGVLKDYPDVKVLAVPGNPDHFRRRMELIEAVHAYGHEWASIVHPRASVCASAVIGKNTLIMPNAVISCNVTIGAHCVILPNTVISHDAQIGESCCIGSNVSISGGVVIGEGSYVGSGVKIRERVRIGQGSLIGIGSNVISDVEANVVVAGNPAKVLRGIA